MYKDELKKCVNQKSLKTVADNVWLWESEIRNIIDGEVEKVNIRNLKTIYDYLNLEYDEEYYKNAQKRYDNLSNIGILILYKRAKRGISRWKLASLTDLSKITVVRVECQNDIQNTEYTFKRIKDILDITEDEIEVAQKSEDIVILHRKFINL